MQSPIRTLLNNRFLALVAALVVAGGPVNHGFAQQKNGAVKELIEELKDADPAVRRIAAISLGKSGSASAAVVPALTEALKDKDWDVRGAAAMSLGRIGSKAKAATAGLAELLADSNHDVRCAAALSLGRIGKEASAAVPKLLALSKKDDKVERVYAAFALAVLDAKARPHVGVLTDYLNDADPQVRGSAVYMLGELGPDAKRAVPELTAVLIDNDKDVRLAAVNALAEMGADAREAVPTLIQLLQDKDADVRTAVKTFLADRDVGRTGIFFLTRFLAKKSYNQILEEYEADADKTGESKAAKKKLADIRAIFENAKSIEVFRLKPPKALSSNELEHYLEPASFHGFEIAQRAVIDKLDRRTELSTFLQKSLHWNSYRQLPSFNPRHGLRVVQGKRTFDLVIALDSNRVNVFEGSEPMGTITILAGKSPIFDDFLRDLAKKEPDAKKETEKKKEPDVKKEPEKKKEPDLKKEPEKKKEPVRNVDLVVLDRDQKFQVLSDLDEKIGARIAKIPGVQAVDCSLTDITWIKKGEDEIALFILGCRPENFMFDGFRFMNGRKFKADEREVALLGARQAGVLNKKVGDDITVAGETLKIIGIYESPTLLENGVMVPLPELQRMMRREGRVTAFSVILEAGRKDQAKAVKDAIEALKDEKGKSLRLAAELIVVGK